MNAETPQLPHDLATARRKLSRLRRRQKKIDYVFGIPMWEHLVYFIVALGIVLWARKIQDSPIEPYALVLGAIAGITAILRPVVVLRWHLNRHHIIMTSKGRIADAEAEVLHLEAQMRELAAG